jgi:signal transduction histidine kinase
VHATGDATADAIRSIAHDLRNLLTAARGHAELALLGLDGDDPAREDIARVVVVATAALEFVEQLGGDPEGGERAWAGPTDMDGALRELAPLIRALVPRGVDIETRLGADGHVPLSRLQLEQVVLNLVMNATDAMPDGGRLLISSAREHPDRLRLDVRDTGPGFSAEALAHLFEEGFTTKRAGRGSGRGLSGCRRIVLAADGELIVASAADGGALVTVSLPVVVPGA